MPDKVETVPRYADLLREAAGAAERAADNNHGTLPKMEARYRQRAAALRALADLCEDATALSRQPSTTHGRTKRAWALLAAIAAGYREGR